MLKMQSQKTYIHKSILAGVSVKDEPYSHFKDFDKRPPKTWFSTNSMRAAVF